MQALPPLNCGQAFKSACQNYCNFSGRSRRSEFFYFYFTINIIIFSLFVLLVILAFNDIEDENTIIPILLFIFVFILASFIPILSSMVRRLHDTGRPTWYILFVIIPCLFMFIPILSSFSGFIYLAGQIYLLVLCCEDSQQMTNEYGPSPKYIYSSGNLIPGNNYIPPNAPINPYPQPNSMIIPVNSNYPNPQQNTISPGISYPQPNPIPNQANPYPQQNIMTNQGFPGLQQNPIQYQDPSNLPQNPLQNINNSQSNPMQQTPEGSFYPPLDDPYSKPNLMQP